MIRNLRDLGGIEAAGGKKIKKHIYFRSAMLNNIDKDDERWFAEEHITKIYDLRTAGECERTPDIRIPGTEYINYYLQDESKKKNTSTSIRDKILSAPTEEERLALVPDMRNIYRAMIKHDYSRGRICALVKTLTEYEDGSVLFHCTSGKDRTGMTAALICCVLGVDREAIYDDYLISLSHAEWESAKMRENFLDRGVSEALTERLLTIFTINPSYLDAFFEEIERLSGSVENFIHDEIKLSDSDIERFRERVLE